MQSEVLMIEPASIDEKANSRKQFQGVKNVFRFNFPMYAAAAFLVVSTLFLSALMPQGLWDFFFKLVAAVSAYFIVVSLLVSLWVYDFSDLYKFNWLVSLLPVAPRRILNLHAGFDEASVYLRLLYPDAQLHVFDFYSPETSTESSIARARAANQEATAEVHSVGLKGWNLHDDSQELVLIFLAAHELRKGTDRDTFFAEVRRVLAAEGRCVLVEHQRDWPNFLAYGVGFLHFLPHIEWRRTIGTSGLKLMGETRITPFIKVFCLCK